MSKKIKILNKLQKNCNQKIQMKNNQNIKIQKNYYCKFVNKIVLAFK